jgi:hypothetical protein
MSHVLLIFLDNQKALGGTDSIAANRLFLILQAVSSYLEIMDLVRTKYNWEQFGHADCSGLQGDKPTRDVRRFC